MFNTFLLFGLLLFFIALSIPIGITIGISTAICMVMTTSIPMTMIAQKCFTGLDSFPLLAIPFFILAGALMCTGGISKRLVNLAESLVGFITGGLAMVTVLACMFFAAISGSGPATVSAIGSFMIPSMKEKRYDPDFAAAVTACAGTIGVIIPPSIPFVIYCVVAQCSIGDLFIVGIIPGIIIGITLMSLVYVISKKCGYVSDASFPTIKSVGKAFKDGIWALFTPIIILGGIYGGLFTPTEAAVVAVVYSIIIGKFVYKELTNKELYNALRSAALINGATQFMMGLSFAFSNYLAIAQIPSAIGNALMNSGFGPLLVFLIINIFLLIVGCFIDNIAAIVILTPILLPVVTSFGMDPLVFGLVMTFNLAIGFITPPYGVNLFVAMAVSGRNIEGLSKAVFPFITVMVVDLLIFTYCPSISLWLLSVLN